jgi:hypothetical protein
MFTTHCKVVGREWFAAGFTGRQKGVIMKTKLLITIITAAFAGALHAQINVGVNYIHGTDTSVHSGSSNTNDASNSSVGGYKNWILTNSSDCFIGGGAYNVAGGLAATIAGGYDNFATNNFSTIGGGIGNTIGANGATIPGGAYAVADHFGQLAYSSQKFLNNGDSQASMFVLREITTDAATTTELSLVGPGYVSRMTIGTGGVWSFRVLVTAKRPATGDTAAWEIKGLIKNISGTPAIVQQTSNSIGADGGASTWTANAAAQNGSLVINVTGGVSSTVYWTAVVTTCELN